MIPEDDPPQSLYNKDEIQMQLDKIPELEKRLDRIENEIKQLKISNKSQHNKIWLQLEKGG